MEIFLAFGVPILILLGLSGILGFLLVYVGDKLAVPHDERLDQVLANLAGANCGGCGYPGCSAFAEALIKGEAEIGLCKPTSKDNKAVIAEILGTTAGDEEETVMVVRCRGGKNAKDKYTYQGNENCSSSALVNEGTKLCPSGCMGFGTCVKVCPSNAIKITKDQYAEVDDSLCTGCGICAKNCPKSLFEPIPKSARVYVACSNKCKGKAVSDVCSVGCIGCGICAKACKYGAIVMQDNLPVIDYSKCTACKECVIKCPKKIIIDKDAAAVNVTLKQTTATANI